jgi:hypothetical protein
MMATGKEITMIVRAEETVEYSPRRIACLAMVFLCALSNVAATQPAPAQDPLPSWQEGPAKQAILQFVKDVTTEGGPKYVPPAERIATFDNDGTLWVEKPLWVEGIYVLEQKGLNENDMPKWLEEVDAVTLFIPTHGGMSTGSFDDRVKLWLDTARHSRFSRKYTDLVYQPQLDLMNYLRANGFRVFVCTGGDVDFVRMYSKPVYGVPEECVIGSHVKLEYEDKHDHPDVMRMKEIRSLNVNKAKPENIELFIGRRPILAFGNSDGDLEMLQYTADNPRPSLCLLVRHDDADREYAYDKGADKVQKAAAQSGWLVVSMKNDWRRLFPSDQH